MLVIISPAKTLDFESKVTFREQTDIRFPREATELATYLRAFSPDHLASLMNVSSDLARLTAERFLQWQWPFDGQNARQALFAFKGDVYTGLDAYHLDADALRYSQNSLRILSGLYGLLRPLDAIMPYRLEMGTKLTTDKGKDLYDFWGPKIHQQLENDLEETGHQVLVNLASNEYSRVIDFKKLKVPTITPVFKDYKNGQYKMVSFFAKKARGWMSRFILENRLTNPDELKAFDTSGYYFNSELSMGNELVFTRH